MRQHLAADGSVLPGGSYAYTPFGVVASGNTPSPFGFTRELHSEGLVYLRARWYDPGVGTFTSRDPFVGFPTRPYSLHYYQYGYSNPVLWTDPSGERVQGYPDYVEMRDAFEFGVPAYALFVRYSEATVWSNDTLSPLIDSVRAEHNKLVGGYACIIIGVGGLLGVGAAALAKVSLLAGGGGGAVVGAGVNYSLTNLDNIDPHATKSVLGVLEFMKTSIFEGLNSEIGVANTSASIKVDDWPWEPYIAFWIQGHDMFAAWTRIRAPYFKPLNEYTLDDIANEKFIRINRHIEQLHRTAYFLFNPIMGDRVPIGEVDPITDLITREGPR